jgi:hypothetical protein
VNETWHELVSHRLGEQAAINQQLYDQLVKSGKIKPAQVGDSTLHP